MREVVIAYCPEKGSPSVLVRRNRAAGIWGLSPETEVEVIGGEVVVVVGPFHRRGYRG